MHMGRGIDISDCRGQGYDNGANMSGKINGVQAQILLQQQKLYNLATFSPCASHTLNLVGVHAAGSSPEVSTFFIFIWLHQWHVQSCKCQSRVMAYLTLAGVLELMLSSLWLLLFIKTDIKQKETELCFMYFYYTYT